MKDYINTLANAERRFLPNQKVEVRAEDSQTKTIRGYAALFNQPTDLMWCMEVIAAGAFDDCLGDDIRCLFNHSSESVLGRTLANTCRVGVDDIGLWYECDLDEGNTDHMNIYRSILRGDINQSSFAFSIKEFSWEFTDDCDTRTILKVEKLYDVSPVTYPAYQDTTVSARGKEDYEALKKSISDEKSTEANKREAFAMKWKTIKQINN